MPHESDLSTSDIIPRLRNLSDDAEFFQDLGKTFSKHKHYVLAKAAYELALQLDPCDPFTHLYLGNWYYRERQLEAALERFECASEVEPDLPVSYWCMADVYETLKRFQEADALHRKAVDVDPSDKQAKRNYRAYRRRRREA